MEDGKLVPTFSLSLNGITITCSGCLAMLTLQYAWNAVLPDAIPRSMNTRSERGFSHGFLHELKVLADYEQDVLGLLSAD